VGDPTPILLKAYSELLGRDWRRQLQEYRKAYVQAKRDDDDQKARQVEWELYLTGRAAAFQGWQNYMSIYSWEEWKRFAQAHRQKFGESIGQRFEVYERVLSQQIREETEIGIPMFPIR
jgi:hypothetical protein